jgi:small multidrug resistance family-3 protein
VVVTVVRPIAVYVLTLAAEILGLWLVWRAAPDDSALAEIGVVLGLLAAYVVMAAGFSDALFVRIVAVYGVLFALVCLGWGMAMHGERPDAFDAAGTCLCLAGAATLVAFAPRD